MSKEMNIHAVLDDLNQLILELQAGDLQVLFARKNDKEWTNGAASLLKQYGSIVSVLEHLVEENARLANTRRPSRIHIDTL